MMAAFEARQQRLDRAAKEPRTVVRVRHDHDRNEWIVTGLGRSMVLASRDAANLEAERRMSTRRRN